MSLFLEERRKGIGGTDVAALAGFSRWKTPMDVFLEKTGREVKNLSSDVLEQGRLLEPLVRRLFEVRQHGEEPSSVEAGGLCTDPDVSFLRGNLDGFWTDSEGNRSVLEFKTTRTSLRAAGFGEEGTDQIPREYMAQVQHYMQITGCKRAYVVVLRGSDDLFRGLVRALERAGECVVAALQIAPALRVYPVNAHPGLQEKLRDRSIRFWRDHVEKDIPPPPAKSSDLDHLFPVHLDGCEVKADEAVEAAWREILVCRKEMEVLTVRREKLEMVLKQAMGQKGALKGKDGVLLASWRGYSSDRLDVKAMRRDHPEIVAKYGIPCSVRRFQVRNEQETGEE